MLVFNCNFNDIIQDTPWDILSNQGGSEWPELLKF